MYGIAAKNVEEIKPEIGLVWFQNNLRADDNASLAEATKKYNQVIGVYFFDPNSYQSTLFGFPKIGKYRAKFLLESVEQLQKALQQLNIPLLIFRDSPEHKMPSLIKKWNINEVFFQKEWTEEEAQQRSKVQSACPSHIQWTSHFDQFLYHPDDIPFTIKQIPKVFTQFRKKLEKQAEIRPLLAPKACNPIQEVLPKTSLPTLQDLGFDDFETDSRTAFPFKGGAASAQDRLQYYVWESKKVSFYKKTRNGLIGKDYSSKFSAWLACGSISARQIYHTVKAYEQEIGKNQSTYWLIFELIWRDFFKYISLKHGNDIFKLGGVLDKVYSWERDQKLIEDWIEGQTESPFVNANMLELKHTGWMSNRGRQNVASYLAKTLEVDWRIGAAYFESMLIDYDVHSNYGNWMYVSGVGNDPRDRTFNVKRQAEMYDPNGSFQKRWLQQTLFS